MTHFLQKLIVGVEVGKAQFLTRLLPLLVVLMIIGTAYNFVLFHGLNDAQSMDNAQLARQIVSGQGYTTRFLRPQAIAYLRNYSARHSLGGDGSADLFPPEQFPKGAPRILPDTYNAPGYPYLLAAWFYLVRPHFVETASPSLSGFIDPSTNKPNPVYSADRVIPPLNLIFVLLTGLLVFFLGGRLFDDRVAWLSAVSFFVTDLVWRYSLTALSTSFLMFLVTAILFCAVEIFCISETCFESEEPSFGMAWVWGILLSLLLAAACLTRLHLLVLLVPLFALLVLMPRPSWFLFIVISMISIGAVLPWFWHMYKVCGNPLGTNMAYVIYGSAGYSENQIFCSSNLVGYNGLFRNLSQKEIMGFLWHMEHGWRLLGSNLLVLLFFASLLHAYKRRRAQMFQWFLIGTSVVIIAANSFGVAQPDPLGAWNNWVLLFPGMIVVGSAFFFIQLDRLNLQVWLLNNIIVIALIAVIAAPMALKITTPDNMIYAFPPYIPPLIKVLSDYSHQDEWVTTDMPWASAWYGDRVSLWLPDTINDFVNLHDNVCPTGILFLTPESWSKPAANILTGEEKDWLLMAVGNTPSPTFPLTAHTVARGPEYIIFSDRPRWQ